MKYLKFLLAGMYFGIVITKAEVVSWYRIQEMFRFQSFHMFGVLGSAVAVGMISVLLIKRFKLRAISGTPIVLTHKIYHKGYFPGGFLFGCLGDHGGLSRSAIRPGRQWAYRFDGYHLVCHPWDIHLWARTP